ncbi:MAG TPA: type II toxin-antitoxin system HigB family toxin [Gemmatimonadales bacterium]|nr:type II toxin-antitoxin system HigB family toxin [Gemmatimonadales bacterium]
MHVITRKRLIKFAQRHADAGAPLHTWYRALKAERFTSPETLRAVFPTARFLGQGLTIFNMAGNKYRLVATVRYATATNLGRVWIREIFTHTEYDRWSDERRRGPYPVAEPSQLRFAQRERDVMAERMQRLDLSTPHVLRTEQEYDAAVAEIDALLDQDAAPETPEGDRLELLTLLVQAYDEEHYPLGDTVTPQAVVDFLLEQQGMSRAALSPILGGRSRVSEFFAGKRRLSISQIQGLRQLLHVSADLLLEPVPT